MILSAKSKNGEFGCADKNFDWYHIKWDANPSNPNPNNGLSVIICKDMRQIYNLPIAESFLIV